MSSVYLSVEQVARVKKLLIPMADEKTALEYENNDQTVIAVRYLDDHAMLTFAVMPRDALKRQVA